MTTRILFLCVANSARSQRADTELEMKPIDEQPEFLVSGMEPVA
jgi:hypothetical protein